MFLYKVIPTECLWRVLSIHDVSPLYCTVKQSSAHALQSWHDASQNSSNVISIRVYCALVMLSLSSCSSCRPSHLGQTSASSSGHNDVAQCLLEAGAVCNEYTFDGDRCHYAALNLGIRTLLRQFEARPPPLSPLASSLRGLSSLCDNPEVTPSL